MSVGKQGYEESQRVDKKLHSQDCFKTGYCALMCTQVTVSGNVDNQNYGSPINPSEIVPDTKPTSPGAEGTQVTVDGYWKDVRFAKGFGVAGFTNAQGN